MKVNHIKTARTIKANRDIAALGLQKEDVLSSIYATKTGDVIRDNMNWFVFKEERSSTDEGFSSYSVKEVNINENTVADFAESFTLIDSFIKKEEEKPVQKREFEDHSTDELIVLYLNILDELDRRMDEKIQGEGDQDSI